MSDFIVSARKYRPATFRSVVGQQHVTSTLRNAIERGQLAHAYLFCGPRGVGKTTCARIFAKAINCLSPEEAEACNRCESCRSFDEGRSLNIHELDAASNNSVEDIRSLIEQVRILPQSGRYSVFIIDEVHMLSAAAFNAFLKTLEEPPAHAAFILATSEKHKIIPTILSRCQVYDFNRIRVEDAVDYLRYIAGEEGVAADDESLNLIARKADGGMRDALSMFDKAVSFCGGDLRYKEVARTLNVLDYDTYFTITDLLLAGDYVQALLAFDEVLSNGFSGQTFMAGLNRHLRDLMVARDVRALRLLEMTGTLLERYRAQAAACDPNYLFGAIALLTELDGKFRQSSDQRLLVELGLMKLAGPGALKACDTGAAPLPLPPLGRPDAGAPAGTPRNAAGASAQAPATAPAAAADRTGQPAAESVVSERPTAASGRGPLPSPLAEPATPSPAGAPAGSATQPESPAAMPPSPTTEPASAPVPATTGDREPAPGGGSHGPASGAAAREVPAPPVQGGRTSLVSGVSLQSVQSAADAAVPAPETPFRSNPQPAASSRPAGRAPLVSGATLAELLSDAGGADPAAETGETPDEAEAPQADPQCGRKLEQARPQILQLMRERRPRFVPAFEQMTVRDHVLAVSVPTPELRDEMLRNKTAMLRRIAELAGTAGPLDLEVTVNEEIRAARPIKLEDRVKHMTARNPLLADLRRALDLEAE